MADVVRTYEIRISAVLDRSTAAAAGDWTQQWDRSNRDREKNERTSHERSRAYVARIRDRYFADQQRQEERAARTSERQQQQQVRAQEKQQQQQIRNSERAAQQQAKAQERAQQYVARIRDRFFADQQRQEERAEREKERASERAAARIARTEERMRRQGERNAKKELEDRKTKVKEIAGEAYATAAAVASKALGVGKEIAGGMGVDFSLGSGVARAVQLQKMAVAIVNAGNRGAPGEDRNGQVQALQDQARSIGAKYAFDPTKMLAGYAQFQAKTGDTATATAGLDRFAKLAKAMNVELDDMISMAGEVSSKLEDGFKPGEERAEKVYQIIKALTAQGQEGAIEIADLAKETARIGGGAGFFKGDIGDTIVRLGSLAQLARQTGGANSSADAARSVAAFVTTLKTPARRKAFDAAGVEYKDKDGSFLDPFTIIKNALRATQGDTEKMNEMFKSSLGTKPVDALAKEFNRAGKGEAGIQAVDKLLAKFSGSVSEDVVNENVGRAMGTTESKAQLFQNKLDAIAASLADRVLPAFERMAPTVEKVVSALADLIAWASNNSGTAITAVIAGSIAKAAIGSVLKEKLVDLIAGGLSKGPASSVGGLPVGGGASALGSALAIGAIAVAAFTVGSMIVDKLIDDSAKADTEHVGEDMRMGNTDSLLIKLMKGMGGKEDIATVQANIADLERRVKVAKGEDDALIGGTFGAMMRAGANWVTASGPDYKTIKKGQLDAEDGGLERLEAKLAEQKADLARVLGNTLTIKGTVEVSNMPTNMSGGPDGRDGTPNHS